MAIELNHTIVACRDAAKSSAFLAEILGLPPPRRFIHFHVVDLSNGVSLDFGETTDAFQVEHYAFLVGEAEFDTIFARLQQKGLATWADPFRKTPGINHLFGGRGAYFEDPDGHILEIITRPYGST
jgi:catechol 2,3-dioxygenase-like lactoylglutathione lyase family enzyme